MGSPALLDFASFTSPISAPPDSDPVAVFREVEGTFWELIREVRPETIPEGVHEKPKAADWGGVVRLAQQTLKTQSRDLRVAAWLAVGLTQVQGFAGLRDGLHLLRLLVDEHWNDIAPPADGDPSRPESLAAILDDNDPLGFPDRVRLVPVLRGDKGAYGFTHYRHGDTFRDKVDRGDFDRAEARIGADRCRALAEDLAECLTELHALEAGLARHDSEHPITLGNLQHALEDCRTWVEELVAAKTPAGLPSEGNGPEAAPGSGSGSPLAGSPVEDNRADAFRLLRRAVEILDRHEPSSPAPRLVEMAIQLENKPFPELMKILAKMQLIGALIQDGQIEQEVKNNVPKESD